MNQRRLGQKLREKGFIPKKANGLNWWIGIVVINNDSTLSTYAVPQSTLESSEGYCQKNEVNQNDGHRGGDISTFSTPNNPLFLTKDENEKKPIFQGTEGTDTLETRTTTTKIISTFKGTDGYLKGTEGTGYDNHADYIVDYLHSKLPRGLMRDDHKFLKDCIKSFDSAEISAVLSGYVTEYQRAYNMESDVNSKVGAGRRAANAWVRELSERRVNVEYEET